LDFGGTAGAAVVIRETQLSQTILMRPSTVTLGASG
jgi:hypothetical protein